MKKRPKIKQADKTAARKVLFLDLWRTNGKAFDGQVTKFCEAHGFKIPTYYWWRNHDEEFARQVDAIPKEWEYEPVRAFPPGTPPCDGLDDRLVERKRLPDRLNKYLVYYEETMRRAKACRESGLLPEEVEEAIGHYEIFRNEIARIDKLAAWDIADAWREKALAGQTAAAKSYLEANDPNYRKRISHEITGSVAFDPSKMLEVQKKMQERFGAHEQKMLEAGDVVEVEYTEIPS